MPLEVHPDVGEVARQRILELTPGPFAMMVRVAAESTRRQFRAGRGDERQLCAAHVDEQLIWVGDVLDALEADRDVELAQVEWLVRRPDFELWPHVVPLCRGDGVGGYVDAFDANGAG